VFRISDALGVESLGKNVRQRALADAYGAFDCYIPGEIEKLGHEYEEVATENIPSATLAQLRKKLTPIESVRDR
jgi:hypothetical protein